jgi:EmrB/QacA subfamily drug resistance transporter
MTTTVATTSASAAITTRSSPSRLLAVLLIGQFMAILDVSIVNVAAPTIRTDLDTSGAALQLVVAGYTISYAMLLVTGARLGDRIGHGRAFRAGLALFTLASLACGLAPNGAALVAFRVIQGTGAAVMMPQIMSLIQRTFVGPARTRALSWYSAVIACGAVVGQVLGGVLVSADLFGTGWRPVFLVNVPIGIVLLALARRGLPSDRGERARTMDPLGVITLSAAVLALVLPLVLGHEEGWPAWCWVSLAGSAVLLAAFVAVERHGQAAGRTPLVTSSVLRSPGFVCGGVVMLLTMVCYGGLLFTVALHLQSGLGFGPARAGLTFAPLAVGFAVTGLTWRRLPPTWHAWVVPIGLAVSAIAYLPLAAAVHSGARVGVGVELDLLVVGLALGLAFSPLLTVALLGVRPADAADASGVMVTVFQLGQVIGVATLGTLYLSQVSRPGAAESGGALAATFAVIAGLSAVAAAVSIRLARR